MRTTRKSTAALIIILSAVLAASIFTANTYGADSSTNQNFHASNGMNQQSPESVVAAFDAALNAHDVKGGLGLFATDSLVYDLAREVYNNYLSDNNQGAAPTCQIWYHVSSGIGCTYNGKDAIGDWLSQLALDNIQVKETSGYEVSGNNVTWNLDISIDLYRGFGIAPLASLGQATVQGGKIQFLELSLTTESVAKLKVAFAKSVRGTVSSETTGILLGVISLALVLPAGAIYYVSRVKSLFAAIPRLEKPWLLLEFGLVSLFVGMALILFRDLFGLSPRIWDVLNSTIFILSTAIFLVAMAMMKRAWTIPSSE